MEDAIDLGVGGGADRLPAFAVVGVDRCQDIGREREELALLGVGLHPSGLRQERHIRRVASLDLDVEILLERLVTVVGDLGACRGLERLDRRLEGGRFGIDECASDRDRFATETRAAADEGGSPWRQPMRRQPMRRATPPFRRSTERPCSHRHRPQARARRPTDPRTTVASCAPPPSSTDGVERSARCVEPVPHPQRTGIA